MAPPRSLHFFGLLLYAATRAELAALRGFAAARDVRGALALLRSPPPAELLREEGRRATERGGREVYDPVLRRSVTVRLSEADVRLASDSAQEAADEARARWVATVYRELSSARALPLFGSATLLPFDRPPLGGGATVRVLDDTALRRYLGYGRERFRPAATPLGRRPALWGAAFFALATATQFSESSRAASSARARYLADAGLPGSSGGSGKSSGDANEAQPDALHGAVAIASVATAAAPRAAASVAGALSGAASGGLATGAAVGSLAALDAVVLRGALAELARRAADPRRLDLLAAHEAGHVVAAHVLGCCVEAVSLSPWARLTWRGASMPGGAGTGAGTLFVDEELSAQLRAGNVTRAALDRWCAVAMAGIAAEAELGGKCAEGGAADEAALRALLGGAVGMPDEAVRAAAVRGAANAALLLREHRAALLRVVAALRTEGASVEEAILALEGLDG